MPGEAGMGVRMVLVFFVSSCVTSDYGLVLACSENRSVFDPCRTRNSDWQKGLRLCSSWMSRLT